VRRRLLFSIALLLLVAAWANGCGGEPTAIVPGDEPMAVQPQSVEPRVVPETMDEGTSTPTLIIAPRREKATMTPTSTPAAIEVELLAKAEQAILLAREDLARRLDLAPEAIRLVSVEAVEWSDASLGCPQPGMMYAQVIPPGFLVVLEAVGQTYGYHTDTGRLVVLCGEDGLPVYPLIPVDPDEIKDGKPWMSNHR
jgi:hypothetical protein